MNIEEAMEKIASNELPEGAMMVCTQRNAKYITIFGTNGKGFDIRPERIELFIEQLENASRKKMLVVKKMILRFMFLEAR